MVLKILGYFVALFLNILDRVIFFLLFAIKGNKAKVYDLWYVGTDKYKVKSVPVPNATYDPAIETPPYRNKEYADKLLETPDPSVRTLADLFNFFVAKHTTKRMMGQRPIKKYHQEYQMQPDGYERQVAIPEFGEMEWQSYTQVAARVNNIMKGMHKFTGVVSGDKLGIFEETCQEWMMCAQACLQHDVTIVTVYANLGDDALVTAFNETEIKIVFTSDSRLAKFKDFAKQMPSLKYVIYNKRYKADSTPELVAKELEQHCNLKVLSLDEVEALGAQEADSIFNDKSKFQKPTPESLALIMYTSGTTGKPKGVMITHANALSAVAALGAGLGDDPDIEPRVIGYLPLAHILELVAEHYALLRGGGVGYGSPKTLTDRGAKPTGDLVAVKPIVMCGVPKVWTTVCKTGRERIAKRGVISQWLFNTAYAARKQALTEGRETPLWNFLVFNNFRSIVGGEMRGVISGGASLSADAQEFVRVCCGAIVVQGYGLTETCAAACLQSGFHEFATKRVGAVVPCCEVKLVSVPEMNYTVQDKPNPRGEIWVRGNNVTKGYYKQPQLTREAFREDGWFLTGDIGELFEDGTFAIIDRKKNLVKLDGGEYVALERIESFLANSPFISPNGICVYGDSHRSYLVAIALPQVSYLTDWAKRNNIPHADNVAELCKNAEVNRAVLKSLEEEAKRNNLRFLEYVKHVTLVAEEWTPENGMLTAAQKLVRQAISKRYEAQIEAMYK